VHMHAQVPRVGHTRRTQILMEPEEYEQLARIAEGRGVSVAELFRSAVREKYLASTEDRLAAVARISAMNVPLGDWSQMKQDIEDAYDAGLP